MRGEETARALLRSRASLIARGNGRSYGDAALNPACVLDMRNADRIIAFDSEAGRITVEAGMLLADLLEFLVPRGFFVPVTPGTKYVTIGGMIAADVHGKNHHVAGSFGRHINSLALLCADGEIRHCSSEQAPDLFHATCGGMGLTGIILTASFRLIRIETPMIRQETLRARNLDEAMAIFEESAASTYTVGWIDCLTSGSKLGRALVYRGEHAKRSEVADRASHASVSRRLRVPIDFPSWVLNGWSVRIFNALYYRRGRVGTEFIHYDPYFYPLDALLDWNRIYGRNGFVQYQCVLPKRSSRAGLEALLGRIAAARTGSFLAVLKLFGPGDAGYLSFPMEGYTLALDFPANPATFNLLLELDEILMAHDGRIYLAKDSRAGPRLMKGGYPKLADFKAARARFDPERKFRSVMSERLDL
ncbi:MAG TPA: FAD-binding oxidoreductase [Alphaproteobacteria bacterium]|nr:FAD-binding oxidoreductase [Alphaproteobacteria bacterium]